MKDDALREMSKEALGRALALIQDSADGSGDLVVPWHPILAALRRVHEEAVRGERERTRLEREIILASADRGESICGECSKRPADYCENCVRHMVTERP